jgi:hypothetical protein
VPAPARPAPPLGQAAIAVKRILPVPAMQWDADMLESHTVQHESTSDLANLTGGMAFGLSPGDVNRLLPQPASGIAWPNLPAANEFPEDVRYFWTRLAETQDLRAGIKSCAGANSYVVFLFREPGLFRVSYRLVPDLSCPDPSPATADVFARYLQVGRRIALTAHYVSGGVQIVDISDPTADTLLPVRWQNRGK